MLANPSGVASFDPGCWRRRVYPEKANVFGSHYTYHAPTGIPKVILARSRKNSAE